MVDNINDMTRARAPEMSAETPWRETVRDIFDELHFAADGVFAGSDLAARLIELIERRHSDYFCAPKETPHD